MFLGLVLGSNSVCASLCQTLKLVIILLVYVRLIFFFFPFLLFFALMYEPLKPEELEEKFLCWI